MPIRARLLRPLPAACRSIVEFDAERSLFRALGIGGEPKMQRLAALQLLVILVEPNARKRGVALQVDTVKQMTDERKRVVRPGRSHARGAGSCHIRRRLRRAARAPAEDQRKNATPVSQSVPPNVGDRNERRPTQPLSAARRASATHRIGFSRDSPYGSFRAAAG
jgi:hypothetical protein